MKIKCTQCGAEVPIETETTTARCPYCETALYLDLDRSVRHLSMDPLVQVKDLSPLLQRKLAYLGVKDPVNVETRDMFYFPFWLLETVTGSEILVAAAAPPLEEMWALKAPAGTRKFFDSRLLEQHEVVEPQLDLGDAVLEGARHLGAKVRFKSASMVHLPLFRVEYTCRGLKYDAFVEAVSGEVIADDWPSAPQKQRDRALGIIAGLAVGLFFVEAVAVPHPGLTLALYLPTAGLVYLLARTTLKRMGW